MLKKTHKIFCERNNLTLNTKIKEKLVKMENLFQKRVEILLIPSHLPYLERFNKTIIKRKNYKLFSN